MTWRILTAAFLLSAMTFIAAGEQPPSSRPGVDPVDPAAAKEASEIAGSEGSGGDLAMSDKTLIEVIDLLDVEEFDTREAATSALMLREDFDDIHVVAALRGAPSPEMRHRLTQIAMHRYFQRMNPSHGRDDNEASLGVDIEGRNIIRPDQNPLLKSPAMMISRTRPGFPAFALLRPRDLITAIEGKPFSDNLDQGEFTARIKEHKPGDTVRVSVLRDGKSLIIPIRLDSFARLDQVHARTLDVPDAALYRPWQEYLAAMLDEQQPEPVIKIDWPKRPAPPPPEAAADAPADKPAR